MRNQLSTRQALINSGAIMPSNPSAKPPRCHDNKAAIEARRKSMHVSAKPQAVTK